MLARAETTDCAEEGGDIFVAGCCDSETTCYKDVAIKSTCDNETDEDGKSDACCFAQEVFDCDLGTLEKCLLASVCELTTAIASVMPTSLQGRRT